PPSDLQQDRADVDAVALGRRLGVPEERGVDAGITEGEGLAIHADRPVLQRADEVVGGVLQGEQVAAVPPTLEVGDRDERLDGAVAGAGAVPGQGRVDATYAGLDGDHRVGD